MREFTRPVQRNPAFPVIATHGRRPEPAIRRTARARDARPHPVRPCVFTANKVKPPVDRAFAPGIRVPSTLLSFTMGFVLTVAGLGAVPSSATSTAASAAAGNGSNGDSMLAYQANLHQAFLQSAMAQNIQIQQQILAQNQALHQLLQQQQMLPPVRSAYDTNAYRVTVKTFGISDIDRSPSTCF